MRNAASMPITVTTGRMAFRSECLGGALSEGAPRERSLESSSTACFRLGHYGCNRFPHVCASFTVTVSIWKPKGFGVDTDLEFFEDTTRSLDHMRLHRRHIGID